MLGGLKLVDSGLDDSSKIQTQNSMDTRPAINITRIVPNEKLFSSRNKICTHRVFS